MPRARDHHCSRPSAFGTVETVPFHPAREPRPKSSSLESSKVRKRPVLAGPKTYCGQEGDRALR